MREHQCYERGANLGCQRPQRVCQHDSITTRVIFTRELMQTRNKARFLAVNRMTRKCFRNLCRLLISDKGGLKARNTISIEEKIMTSIQVLKVHTTRVIYEMFQHSSSTVSHIHTYEDPYKAAVFWAFRPPLSLIRSLHRFLKHFLVILFTARNLALLRVCISSLVNITRVVMES